MTRYSRVAPCDRALHHLDEAADTVLLVDDEVARPQLEGIDLVAPARRHPTHVLGGGARARLSGQVGLGQQLEALGLVDEAAAEGTGRHADRPRGRGTSSSGSTRTSCSRSTSSTRLARPGPSVTTATRHPSAVRARRCSTARSVSPRNASGSVVATASRASTSSSSMTRSVVGREGRQGPPGAARGRSHATGAGQWSSTTRVPSTDSRSTGTWLPQRRSPSSPRGTPGSSRRGHGRGCGSARDR